MNLEIGITGSQTWLCHKLDVRSPSVSTLPRSHAVRSESGEQGCLCLHCTHLLCELRSISQRCFPRQVYSWSWLCALETLTTWWSKNVILQTINKPPRPPHQAITAISQFPFPAASSLPTSWRHIHYLIRKQPPAGFTAEDWKRPVSVCSFQTRYWIVLKAWWWLCTVPKQSKFELENPRSIH